MNDPFIGHEIGPYRIERLLGRGGMASVYFAWDTKHDHPVALKVLDERSAGSQSAINRFVNEAVAIASWDQLNIVHVMDVGQDGDVYYYAMEYIRGLDLSQLMRQYLEAGRIMPHTEVLRIGWAMAEALDFAHSHGIIHRDVKPSNVLISVDGRVLLSDFGLVMDIARGTQGEIFGSPAYMAPEQARTSASAVPQSDLYALGVMLYEMLTGVTPFYDPSPASLALKHLNENPPLPRALNPRLSMATEAVLLRGLNKQPGSRYATGREMLSAIERALKGDNGQGISSAPLPLPPEALRLRAQRGQPVPASSTAAAAAAAAGAAGSFGTTVPGAAPNASTAANPANRSTRPYPVTPPGNTQVVRPPQPAAGAGQHPGATSVRPAVPYTASGHPVANNAQYSQSQRPVYTGAPSYSGAPSYGPPPVAQPRKRGGGLSMGCLALVLTALLAVVVGGALAYNSASGLLSGLSGLIPALPSVQPSEIPGEPTEVIAPTETAAPTETLAPTEAPTPTETPAPTPTLEPTPTAQPTATAPPPPTIAPIPTQTVPPVVISQNLAIAKRKTEGLVMVNLYESQPIDLNGFSIRTTRNNQEVTLLLGEEWEQDILQPGECVSVFEKGVRVRLPSGVECDRTGQNVSRSGDDIFWTRTFDIFYNDKKIVTCESNEPICQFSITD